MLLSVASGPKCSVSGICLLGLQGKQFSLLGRNLLFLSIFEPGDWTSTLKCSFGVNNVPVKEISSITRTIVTEMLLIHIA